LLAACATNESLTTLVRLVLMRFCDILNVSVGEEEYAAL